MVELINPPETRELLPPLLACLPLAFVSPRAPPALLPLLSPILRQRVGVLSSLSTSSTESWLQLLCWEAGKAERLQRVIDGATFEPHPVSGEIELPDELPVTYKRIDDETLKAQVPLAEYSLTVVYLWCPTDEEGGGRGWRVAELLPREGAAEDDDKWASSIWEANVQAKDQLLTDILKAAEEEKSPENSMENDDDDDDDYWAQYDSTPGAKTPAPPAASSKPGPSHLSEQSYFSQYGDVQPAMDNHDPTEEQPEVGPSSLNGDMLANLLRRQVNGVNSDDEPRKNGYAPDHIPSDKAAQDLNHPRPASASSGSSDAIAKLEHEAESRSTCEVGVKQHIGTSIKSLFRLAKVTGMSRGEFQALVSMELELLDITDDD
ncbi:hypothetical protein CBS147339_389 [Penicillium roqueforti]|uniref:Genomic scaffold, ProqFM164S02 n=1 Tax=Penicillium roqueforti (strain FM164) TaxID=1365484 RepID=W6Q2U8_PENRF|nr:hypothetical protein CBS147354_36 [Penicillium roqueforti]CDM30888.1 unnamed protein product [Penicillium roqueforti FM164]KAI2751599.1 hypothetical protein DTO012A8_9811 [Penicillium roqueforti]KAI3086545.1 hypothetical protein CBS147339_389 [Penicillium roqueforti]KAI3107580.1 hypothetical protein CBS147338_494 [Penicillium roqueforti]